MPISRANNSVSPWVAGISGGPDGCYSVALSGGYEDDVDSGEGLYVARIMNGRHFYLPLSTYIVHTQVLVSMFYPGKYVYWD